MAKPIQMPALSPTMTEGKITRWLKKVGDKVSSGDALAEVETDKSNLEIEAYDDGFLISIGVDEGQSAPVGQPIGFIGEKGEAAPAGGAGAKPAAPAKAPEAKPQPEAKAPPKAPPSKPAAPSGPRATAIPMPALSPTMKEGKITQWLKKEGDKVSSGEALAEVETDKSTLNIESYEDGILLQIRAKEGESAPVGAPIAFVGPKGAQIVEEGGAPPVPSPEEPPAEARPAAPAATKQVAGQKAEARGDGQVVPFRREGGAAAAPLGEKGGRVFASPLAKRIAHERGVDLSGVAGSGPQGRIVKRDVEQAAREGSGARARGVQAPAPAAPAVGRAVGQRVEPKRVEISSMRKVIAQRMTEVKPGVPHFYLSVDIEMDAALEIRDQAKQLDQKVSVNDIIVKAAAVALRKVPKMNVSFAGDHVLQHENADVGIAVAIEDGLITPVVRDADLKGLGQISAEARDFAARAKQRKLRPEEYAGGSITVSNLGMYGIDSFIAVINPPQAAIIAVGGANERVVVRDGQMVVRKVMTATLSGDHRVIDGALGAVYLKELKELLEHPLRLLL